MKVTSCQENPHLYASPGLHVSTKPKPPPNPILAGQKQDRGKVRLTHSWMSYPRARSLTQFSKYKYQRKKRTAKGKGWLRSLVTRPPLTSFFIRKGKETKEEKRQGDGGWAGEKVHFHLSCQFPPPSQNKGHNSIQLSPLLSQQQLPSASEPKSP